MDKKVVLIFGALLQGDIFEDGYGTTREDEKLLTEALRKIYGVTENTTKEEGFKAEKRLNTDIKELVKEYRDKIIDFIRE